MRELLLTGLRMSLGVFCASLIFTFPAKADMAALRSSDNQIWISGGGSFFNYKEPAQAPDLPDSERGWLGSVGTGATFLTDSGLYFATEGDVNWGNAKYNGAYFDAPTTPLQSTTQETIYTVDGQLGKAYTVSGSALLIPYLEIGFRSWDRNLGEGQDEKYQNYDTLAGLKFQIAPTSRLILSAYGAAGPTFSAQMKTFGDTYQLGSNGIYKIGGKIGFDLTPRVELFTTLDYDHFRYTQSGVVDGAYEPSSHTEDTSARVGIGYHFR